MGVLYGKYNLLDRLTAYKVRPVPPRQVAEELDEENIYVWDGNYYAQGVTERLGLEDSGGEWSV